MKIIVHRGGSQIGGCITEILTDEGHKIFIDLGENLTNQTADKEDDPMIAKVASLTANAKTVLYTHHHGDHVGLSPYVADSVPQYISEGGKRVLVEIQKHIPDGKPHIYERMRSFEMNKPFKLDGMPEVEEIVPIRVSHSAFESCMFYLRIDGINILHTGDFRLHGIQDKDLIENIKTIAKDVHVLIIEGTMLNRNEYEANEGSMPWNEQRLIDVTKDLLTGKQGMKPFQFVYAISSSTDAERLWSFYTANHTVGYKGGRNRLFVVDKYQYDMLKAFTELSESLDVPYKFDGEEIRKFSYDDALFEEMAYRGAFILLRANKWEFKKANVLLTRFKKQHTLCLYSAWIGYLSKRFQSLKDSGYWTAYDENFTPHENLVRLFGSYFSDISERQGIPRRPLHTGGHARREDLLAMCKAVNPSVAIVPIHKEASADFLSLNGLEDLKSKVYQPDKDFGSIEIEEQ